MGLDFVAIDVETANADMASICQIGIASFADGRVVEEWKSYVDPEDYFDGMNVSIHGITEAIVAGSPIYTDVHARVRKALESNIVVTHTAFDRTALSQVGLMRFLLSGTLQKHVVVPRLCHKEIARQRRRNE